MNKETHHNSPHNHTEIPKIERSQLLLIGAEHDVHYKNTRDLIPKHLVEKLDVIRNQFPNVAYRGNDITEIMKTLYPSYSSLPSSRSNQVRAYQNSFVTSFSVLMRMHEIGNVTFPGDAPMQSLYEKDFDQHVTEDTKQITPWYLDDALIAPDDTSSLYDMDYPFRVGHTFDRSIPTFYKEHQDYCDAVDIWAYSAVPTYLEKESSMFLPVAAGQLEAYFTVQDLHSYRNQFN